MSAEEQLGLQFANDQPGKEKPRPIPTKAHIEGIGHVRVLGYEGNNRFSVLDRTDTKRFVHRDRLSFRK